MNARTKQVRCPNCGSIVEESDLVVREFPEKYAEIDVSDLDAGLPEKYRGTGAVRSFARMVHVQTMCASCDRKSVN